MYTPSKQGLPASNRQYVENELQKISQALNQHIAGLAYADAAAGVPAFTPAEVAGKVPLWYDSTGNRLYAYSAGAWHVL